YETVVGYFIEASACTAAHPHGPEVIVLDRPPLLGGEAMQGPVSDTPASYINYMPEPVRNGMTLGELARLFHGTIPRGCSRTRPDGKPVTGPDIDAWLSVVKMEGWKREEFFDETGVRWVNPSPNLRSVEEAVLYPGLGMLDATNVSVGRGTATPFEVFGAGWMSGKAVADFLTARKIPGVTFEATRFAVAETPERYPGHGKTIDGVRMAVTDRAALDSPEMGIEVLNALHHLYPKEFQLQKAAGLVANTETMDGLERGDDPRIIAQGWAAGLVAFEARRERCLLYH
ncbi:MAG TPA: DUF1343 domain-containing protein, partial [Acidobacteriaceae bacterium]|nr:DUF1343 domain-containing protein [Acidobacteriaceae bacterium]